MITNDLNSLAVISLLLQIWIKSPHSSSGYYPQSDDDTSRSDHFDAHLATGDMLTSYCRTGYLGFVRRTEMTQSDGGQCEWANQHCRIAVHFIVLWAKAALLFVTERLDSLECVSSSAMKGSTFQIQAASVYIPKDSGRYW